MGTGSIRRAPTGRIAACITGLLMVLLPVTASALEEGEAAGESTTEGRLPLAPWPTLQLQNYFAPMLYDLPAQVSANRFLIRAILPLPRQFIRITLPILTAPSPGEPTKSGLGDLNLFDIILLTRKESSTHFGIGPLLVVPTANEKELGRGKWQLGGAAATLTRVDRARLGALVTYQVSVAGNRDREEVSRILAQPLALLPLNGGLYLSSTAIWSFDLENGHYAVPLGIGGGRIIEVGSVLVDFFLEPQFTLLHFGAGEPALQIFGGVNLQLR